MTEWFSENWLALVQIGINGLTNGMIIALIALGYTMVYGIVELINFAHGDLFMLGCFCALTVLGLLGGNNPGNASWWMIAAMLAIVPLFCAALNWSVDRLVYRPIRSAPKLTVLVSAIGVSFVFVNLGMFWGGLPMDIFGGGTAAVAPKDFPNLIGDRNLLGDDATVNIGSKDVLVFAVTLPLLAGLTWLVKTTRLGRAMRAVAQNPSAARLMGIDVDRVISATFVLGGALAGVASVVSGLYTNTISFQMGFRGGMDAFTAAVLGGIGNLPGAVIGALVIGLARSYTQFFLSDAWASVITFGLLILLLVFRPSGLLGAHVREKV